MNVSTRILIPSVYNLRDLGGILTKDNKEIVKGRLYRANSLSSISDADILKLKALNVKKVYDLRTFDERDEKPDMLIGDEENIHVPIMEKADMGIDKNQMKKPSYLIKVFKESFVKEDAAIDLMRKTYQGFVEDEYSQKKYEFLLKDILKTLEDNDGSIMYHCSSGKDRTGLTTVYLLEILGVGKKDIIDDYLLSNEYVKGDADHYLKGKLKWLLMIAGKKTRTGVTKTIKDFLGVRKEYILEAYKYVEDNYGDMDTYLTEVLNITDDLKERFRSLLLI